MAYVKVADRKVPHVKLNALSVAKMLNSLLEGATSVTELTAVSGLSVKTIRVYVTTLLKEKCIHVSAWEKDAQGKPSIRVLTLGHGRSVPMPTRSKKERDLEYRARKKAKKIREAFSGLSSVESEVCTEVCTEVENKTDYVNKTKVVPISERINPDYSDREKIWESFVARSR